MNKSILHINSNITAWVYLIFCLILSLCFSNCRNPMGVQPLDETPTRGNIRICVDESFKLLFDTQLYTFQSLYINAKIKADYKPEKEVIQDLINDSVQNVVCTRDLTQSEKDFLFSQKYVVRSTKVAHDAIALIINPENPDSLLLVQQFEDILKGKLKTWKEINPKSSENAINVVFDNNKSANVRYFRDKFSLTGNFPSNCFAVNSNEEVMNYVKKNRNALGIISVNWISDTRDSTSEHFLKSIKVVEVGKDDATYCKPYQGYIAEGSYPFCRDVYMLGRETFSGLGSGFISFVAGDKGQRIILKSGLVPATMPIRLIEINRE
ncbi:MAG: substrate-binding domain-containing protein [Bacteroidetes bacterium]|nr:substrate-binding domain-containing protein [Bacteroidota bacterium]